MLLQLYHVGACPSETEKNRRIDPLAKLQMLLLKRSAQPAAWFHNCGDYISPAHFLTFDYQDHLPALDDNALGPREKAQDAKHRIIVVEKKRGLAGFFQRKNLQSWVAYIDKPGAGNKDTVTVLLCDRPGHRRFLNREYKNIEDLPHQLLFKHRHIMVIDAGRYLTGVFYPKDLGGYIQLSQRDVARGEELAKKLGGLIGIDDKVEPEPVRRVGNVIHVRFGWRQAPGSSLHQ